MSILSASRKTDIPTYFSDWFLNRLEAKEFYIRNNPHDPSIVTKLTFNKEDIDCIVFWTKNPIPMLNKLDRLNATQIPYYFQFTITGYGKNLEKNIPNDISMLINAFKEISKKSSGNVVWRYDPIVIDNTHTMNWHLSAFSYIAEALEGYTERCVISFVDLYKHISPNLIKAGLNVSDINDIKSSNNKDFFDFCFRLSEIAHSFNIKVFTCAEELVLSDVGINRGSCIDKELIEKIIGYEINASKDKGQRSTCLCAESIDIGKYDTCKNGCLYCYACKNPNDVDKNFKMYDPNSLLLCDVINSYDIIKEKQLHSLRAYDQDQLTLF